MNVPWTRAIVVGGTGGIGEAIARQLKLNGCDVAVVGRNQSKLDAISSNLGLADDRTFPFDILDFDHAQDAFDAIVQKMGGLDLFVFAAGVMTPVGETEYDTSKDKLIIDTNLTAAIAWCNAAAKRFERGKAGTIIGIGSPSGDRGRRGNPAYGASKAGFETYLESLRNRLAKSHVSVVTAKPGPVRTPMTESFGKLPGMIEADLAAEIILKKSARFSKVFYVPGKWWIASKVMRLIPSLVFRRMRI
ncbi:MAG: SDR family NAD(P)-dependent oxidoreductase [Armatimonadota bacterium]|nr:SDR family NAD(P)-dependent oxidoreductase [Armatimonadota bacterium]